MSQRAALLIGKLTHTNKEWQECAQVASKLYEYPDGSREDFISKCKSGEFDNVFALYRSNDSNPITGDFNEELVEALPKSLKFVCHNGAGYNNIDVAACTKRGISVSSTPIAVDDATADVAIWLMLGALRNIKQSYMAVNAGMLRYCVSSSRVVVANRFLHRQMARKLLPRPRSQRQDARYPRHGRNRLSGRPPRESIRHEDPIP
jgi:glyoxylate reductase